MDPIQQIFTQIGAATARGEGMGQYFMQGRQLAQQDERIDLERQSLDLRERLALSDEVMKRFDYEEKVRMVDERVNNAAALSALGEYMGKAISSGTAADPSSAQPIWDIVSKNPLVVGDDRFKEMWSKYTAAATLQQARTQFEAQHGPEGSRQRIAELNAAAGLARARTTVEGAIDRTVLQQEGATRRAQIMAEASVDRAEIIAGVQRDNARVKAIRDRAGDTIYRSFLVQASAIKDSIDLTDAQKQAQIQALEDEYLGRLREAGPAIPVVPLAPPASDALLQGLAPATNAVTPPTSGNKRIIYRPK